MFKYIKDLKEVVERQDTKIGILVDEVRHLQSLLTSGVYTTGNPALVAPPITLRDIGKLGPANPVREKKPPQAFDMTPAEAEEEQPQTFAEAVKKTHTASKKAGNVKAAGPPLRAQPQIEKEKVPSKAKKMMFGSNRDVVVLQGVIDLTHLPVEDSEGDSVKRAAEYEPRPQKTIEPVNLLISKVPPSHQFTYKKWREVIAQDRAIPKEDVLSLRHQQDHKMVVVVERKSALAIMKQLKTVNRHVEALILPEKHQPSVEERKWWLKWQTEERHRTTRRMIEDVIGRFAPNG